jgi:hypothetical protein
MMEEAPRDARLHEGTRYPTDHLMAILDNKQEAERAAQVLHDTGFADVALFHGRRALQAIQANKRRENPLRRSWERVSVEMSDETDSRRHYLGALRQGRSVVMVYAQQPAQVDLAVGILRAHQAHAIQFFGRWTIADLGGEG